MSAIEETRSGTPGKSTQGGGLPSVGDATQALALPHLPYGDAVYAELAAAGLRPDVMEAGLRASGSGGCTELFLRLVWLDENPALGEAVRPYGLTVAWSPLTGWAAHVADDAGDLDALLDVHELAAPALVVDASRHLAKHGTRTSWVPPANGRWEHAVHLDIALVAFDEREATR